MDPNSSRPCLPIGLRVLALVQAGGRGSRMDVLTRERAKPALPFAATHALIDFTLSSLSASGISEVWVHCQFQSRSLDDHLAGGRPWDLDRQRGGFRRITPEEGSGASHEEGFSHGNADALFRIRDMIRVEQPDVLVVAAADHVVNLDLRPVLAHHLQHGAEATVVTAQVGVQEASHQVVVTAAEDGRVTRVDVKPDAPAHGTVATEFFLYDPEVLITELERLRRELDRAGDSGGDGDHDDTGLGDFGEHLLPALVERGRVRAVPVEGYWKDVGRPEAYLQAHRDLLAGRLDVFDHPDRPVLSPTVASRPGLIEDGALVRDAMIGPGCRVRGTVERSVLGPGVRVEAGAVIRDSVLLGNTVVRSGAVVDVAIVDEGVTIGRDAVVGGPLAGTRLSDDAITLLGRDAQVPAGGRLDSGGRLEPGATV